MFIDLWDYGKGKNFIIIIFKNTKRSYVYERVHACMYVYTYMYYIHAHEIYIIVGSTKYFQLELEIITSYNKMY